MEAELLLGVLVLVILWFQSREGMATGVFDASNGMPEPAQVNEIFDQIMSMASPVLQQAYAEALAFAQSTFVEAKALAAKYPDDENLALGIATAKTSDNIVELSKIGVVFGLLTVGNEVKRRSGAITETSLHAAIDPIYTTVTQHINDAVPPFVAPPNMSSAEAAELKPKVTEYAEKARALVKKYDTPEVRDALVALLKVYYVDQLAPSAPAPPAAPPREPKCPIGFEMDETTKTCHVSCPPGFAYSNAGGDKPKCSKGTDFEYFLPPNLPPTKESFSVREHLPGDDELSAQQRAAAALQAAQTEQSAAVLRQQEYQAAHQKAVQAGYEGENIDASRDTNAKMYQSSRLRQQTADMIDDFLAKSPSPRPATAGTPDAEEVKQRKKILSIQAKHLYVIQAALLTLLLSILAFLVMPAWAAQMSVVLILATGVAAAIYLSQIQ
jgi:hypothetical protein